MNITVSRVAWEQASSLLKNIREQVFICEWRIPQKIEFDMHDSEAVHMIACDDETQEPIATGRLLLSDGVNGEISRIAVLKPYRKYKVDKQILASLLNAAQELGLEQISINSPLTKVAHYQANHFSVVGNVYMEAGIARQKLVCPLNQFNKNCHCIKGYLSH